MLINSLAVLMSGFLFRIDGWGRGDSFLPFWPYKSFRSGGINYTRYLIGFVVWAATHNPIYVISYALAASIPYGEKHAWMKYGLWSWFLIGFIWGYASLNPWFALWLGCLVTIVKKYDLDWAITEFFVFGVGSTIWMIGG